METLTLAQLAPSYELQIKQPAIAIYLEGSNDEITYYYLAN